MVSEDDIRQWFEQLKKPLPPEILDKLQDKIIKYAPLEALSYLFRDEGPSCLISALIFVVAHFANQEPVYAGAIRYVLCGFAQHKDSGVRHAVADALGLLPAGGDTREALAVLSQDRIEAVAIAARESLEDLSKRYFDPAERAKEKQASRAEDER